MFTSLYIREVECGQASIDVIYFMWPAWGFLHFFVGYFYTTTKFIGIAILGQYVERYFLLLFLFVSYCHLL